MLSFIALYCAFLCPITAAISLRTVWYSQTDWDGDHYVIQFTGYPPPGPIKRLFYRGFSNLLSLRNNDAGTDAQAAGFVMDCKHGLAVQASLWWRRATFSRRHLQNAPVYSSPLQPRSPPDLWPCTRRWSLLQKPLHVSATAARATETRRCRRWVGCRKREPWPRKKSANGDSPAVLIQMRMHGTDWRRLPPASVSLSESSR